MRIKFRESFRPFAPSMLADKSRDFVDLPYESPYMLMVGPVQEKQIDPASRRTGLKGIAQLKVRRSTVPAITHVDYSARVQTVDPVRNHFYYKTMSGILPQDRVPGHHQHVVSTSAASRSSARSRMPTAVSCARTWTSWWSRTRCS